MINQLLDSVAKAKANDSYNSGRWVTNEEGTKLYEIALAGKFAYGIECGTANGVSACFMATAGLIVHTFDIVDRAKIWEKELVHLKPNIVSYTEPFENEVQGIVESLNRDGPILFFIDGDHSTSGIYRDWNAVKPLLIRGDNIVFHDIRSAAPVARFWSRLTGGEEGKSSRFHEYDTRRGIGHMVYDILDVPACPNG